MSVVVNPSPGERLSAGERSGRRGLAARLGSAVVAIPIIFVVVRWAPLPLFAGFILALVLVAQWELYRMFARVGVRARSVPGLLVGGGVVLAFALGGAPRPWLVPLSLSIAVAGCLALGLVEGSGSRFDWTGISLTLLGVSYCAWLLGHAIWLRALPDGPGLTLLLLGVTWCGEAAAYFVGRRWGRRKLAPRVSPHKTIEGAAAQVVVSVLVALVPVWGTRTVTPLHLAGIGLTLGVIGQVGDLAESFLKRAAETKDAGGIIPGHGGLLDRLDSLLFNAPALYYYVTLVFVHE